MTENRDKSRPENELKRLHPPSGIYVFGKPVDQQTRCEHYHSELDIMAIRFKCCDLYYPCFACHEETSNHSAQVWDKNDLHAKAILCGVCGVQLTIHEYLHANYQCPQCHSQFNPGCRNHYHLYFSPELATN